MLASYLDVANNALPDSFGFLKTVLHPHILLNPLKISVDQLERVEIESSPMKKSTHRQSIYKVAGRLRCLSNRVQNLRPLFLDVKWRPPPL